MKSHCVVIACSERKATLPAEAQALYTGTRFALSLAYANTLDADVRILSAKHGVIKRSAVIMPYDVAYNRLSAEEQYVWAENAAKQLAEYDQVTILADDAYALPVAARLRSVVLPFANLNETEQKSWLRMHLRRGS